MHALRIEDGKIADYAIVAPTEWNFHPDGPFVREASGWMASTREAAELRLKALVLALDPCVEYQIVLREADDA
jgi:coenzyme F420-reducing hydrogenase alpha subunit